MQRDMDLVRAILLAIEASPHGEVIGEMAIDGYTAEQIGYHAYLLNQAGLIKAMDVTAFGNKGPRWRPTTLTWAGHEFLADAKDETVWAKAKGAASAVAGGVSLAVIKDLLVYEVKARLHLPP